MKTVKDLKRFSLEWWKNFFFYYKWHVIIGLVALLLIVATVWSNVTRVEPDLYVLFSGDFVLTEEDYEILQSRMKMAISDINRDNRTTVQFVEGPLRLDTEKVDETTAPSNYQMQMQFATGEQHIYVLDRELFYLYDGQGLLDTKTLCVETKESPLFEGTSLSQRDAVMVTRVKRHDFESDFTTSQELIDYWKTNPTKGDETPNDK